MSVQLSFGAPLRTVVCLGAHADDIEIGAYGTVATLASAHPDAAFVFVVVSGTGERADEAQASARAMLGDRVTIRTGDFVDGYVPYRDPGGVKDLIRSATSGTTPDLVIAPHRSDLHQDHRFVAELAGQLFRGPQILGYEIVKFDGDLGAPNIFVPLAGDVVAAKVAHLASHFPSQEDKPWYTRDAFEAIMRIRGIESLAPSGFAEAFYATKVVLG